MAIERFAVCRSRGSVQGPFSSVIQGARPGYIRDVSAYPASRSASIPDLGNGDIGLPGLARVSPSKLMVAALGKPRETDFIVSDANYTICEV